MIIKIIILVTLNLFKKKLHSLPISCQNMNNNISFLDDWKVTLCHERLCNISFNWNLCLLMHAAKKHSSKISNGFLNKVNWRKCQELNGVEQLKTRCIEYEVRQHKMPYGLDSFQYIYTKFALGPIFMTFWLDFNSNFHNPRS